MLIQTAEIFDCYFICLFSLYMIWWMNSTWALRWWLVFIYRPKNMSKHGWCSILTSSLVQLEAKMRYMFIDIALVFLVLWRLFSTAICGNGQGVGVAYLSSYGAILWSLGALIIFLHNHQSRICIVIRIGALPWYRCYTYWGFRWFVISSVTNIQGLSMFWRITYSLSFGMSRCKIYLGLLWNCSYI